MQRNVPGRTRLAFLGLFVLGIAMAVVPRAAADEPQPCQRQCDRTGHELLGKIPYIGRLFVGSDAKAQCPDAAPIGFEFMIVDGKLVAHDVPADQSGPATFLESDCQVCPLPEFANHFVWRVRETCDQGTCAAAATACAVKKETPCCAAKCAASACSTAPCAASRAADCRCDVKCGTAACCDQLVAKASRGTCPVKEHWEELAELVAENAAMEATLEAHEELLETRSEMLETLAETLVEKAKLEAKLEMVEHRDSMLKEMVELQSENARLKAHAELAQQKEELFRSQLATVLENERLKQRVAELEQQRSAEELPVLTSKRAEKKKAR